MNKVAQIVFIIAALVSTVSFAVDEGVVHPPLTPLQKLAYGKPLAMTFDEFEPIVKLGLGKKIAAEVRSYYENGMRSFDCEISPQNKITRIFFSPLEVKRDEGDPKALRRKKKRKSKKHARKAHFPMTYSEIEPIVEAGCSKKIAQKLKSLYKGGYRSFDFHMNNTGKITNILCSELGAEKTFHEAKKIVREHLDAVWMAELAVYKNIGVRSFYLEEGSKGEITGFRPGPRLQEPNAEIR